ncbi:unnamed protein product [Schistosoma margrebowiei]|uniref:Uncharacterized protein n=1 Tax=Schistosoma margrebowiei TaxID=48269 RepID=A0A183MP87_9TREM|nr:unnamed protein product [Schistosoma margrebowiei]
MEDVRTRRGADIASDHHLVVANLKLKLKKNWTTGQTALQRFQALKDRLKGEETTMEENWKCIKEALTSTCQEVLSIRKHHRKEWVFIETLDRIRERKNKKTAINNNRTRALRNY